MVDSIKLVFFIIFNRPRLVRVMTRRWLGDHYRWYRQLRGGHWYCLGNFWEQESSTGILHYKRGWSGFNKQTHEDYWLIDQIFPVKILRPTEVVLLEPRQAYWKKAH